MSLYLQFWIDLITTPFKRFLRNREIKREQCADPQWKKETS